VGWLLDGGVGHLLDSHVPSSVPDSRLHRHSRRRRAHGRATPCPRGQCPSRAAADLGGAFLACGRRLSATGRSVGPMTDDIDDPPWEPPLSGTEAEHVLGALDRLRWTFRFKADDLDAAGLAATVGASSLTLGGLLKHLAVQEDYATAVKMDGEDMP